MTRQRWKLWAAAARTHAPALCVASGIATGQCFAWWCGSFGIGILVALWAAAIIVRSETRRSLGVVALGALSCLSHLGGEAPAAGSDVMVPLVVEREPERPKPGLLFLEGRMLADGAFDTRASVSAIDLPWRNASAIVAGDIVWIRGKCRAVRPDLDPMSRDSTAWRHGTSVNCRATFVSTAVAHHSSRVSEVRERIRSIAYGVGGDVQATGLFLSAAFGVRSTLSMSTERDFKVLGLTHMLVVSGYQVTIVFGTIAWLWAQMRRRLLLPTLPGVLLALACTTGYCVLVGMETSTVRALVAGWVIGVRCLDEHSGRFSQASGVALTALLLWQPWCFFDAGVQLTFAALFGIRLATVLFPASRVNWVQFVALTLMVWLSTTMVTLVRFGSVSLLAPVMNLLVAAACSFWNCIVGGLGLLLSSLGIEAGQYLLMCAFVLNELLLRLVAAIARYDTLYLEELGPWARTAGGAALVVIIATLARAAGLRHERVWLCRRAVARLSS